MDTDYSTGNSWLQFHGFSSQVSNPNLYYQYDFIPPPAPHHFYHTEPPPTPLCHLYNHTPHYNLNEPPTTVETPWSYGSQSDSHHMCNSYVISAPNQYEIRFSQPESMISAPHVFDESFERDYMFNNEYVPKVFDESFERDFMFNSEYVPKAFDESYEMNFMIESESANPASDVFEESFERAYMFMDEYVGSAVRVFDGSSERVTQATEKISIPESEMPVNSIEEKFQKGIDEIKELWFKLNRLTEVREGNLHQQTHMDANSIEDPQPEIGTVELELPITISAELKFGDTTLSASNPNDSSTKSSIGNSLEGQKIEGGVETIDKTSVVMRNEIVEVEVSETDPILNILNGFPGVIHCEKILGKDAHELLYENGKSYSEGAKSFVVEVEPKPPDSSRPEVALEEELTEATTDVTISYLQSEVNYWRSKYGDDLFISYLQFRDRTCRSGRELTSAELRYLEVLFGEFLMNRFWYCTKQTTSVKNYVRDWQQMKAISLAIEK